MSDQQDAARYRYLLLHAEISLDMGALRMVIKGSPEAVGAKALMDCAIDSMLPAQPRDDSRTIVKD